MRLHVYSLSRTAIVGAATVLLVVLLAGRLDAPAAAKPKGADNVWNRLAHCESSGNWQSNTGNGYYGGLQFSLTSWRAAGGEGSPAAASRTQQIKAGKRLQKLQGWRAWPACSAKLGLR